MAINPKGLGGPLIHAADPWLAGTPTKGLRHQLLGDTERMQLAKISSMVRFNDGRVKIRTNTGQLWPSGVALWPSSEECD